MTNLEKMYALLSGETLARMYAELSNKGLQGYFTGSMSTVRNEGEAKMGYVEFREAVDKFKKELERVE